MSRIDFGVALFVATALACVFLGPASARTPAPAPAKYGGTLVIGIAMGDPGSLDPTVNTGGALVIFKAMCHTLYTYDANQHLVPLLAANLPALSKDKLSYTIQLRQGVEFNDGTPLNAQAVVTSVQRLMTYPGSTRSGDYASVNTVAVTGPYTVVFHLKARDSTFTGSSTYIFSPTQLTKLGDNFASNPICVGPFMFDHRVVGDNITLIKSPYYYDQKNVYLDKVVFKPTPDAPAAAAALKAGDIQAINQLSVTELDGVRQNPSLRVVSAYQWGWRGIRINIGNKNGVLNLPYTPVGTALASSAKLRQAFDEAIDRSTLNKVVFDGLDQVSCSPVAPANTTWYDKVKVACTSYNPKDAKKLVAESGFPSPTVHLLTSNATELLRLAQFIQAQEAAVGINVVIDSTDNAGALARAASGSFDVYLTGFSASPDPNSVMNTFLGTSGSRNVGGYSNPRLDLILANGLKATDAKARATLYRVAQQIIRDERPIIYLYNLNVFAAFSANLTGVKLSASGTLLVENARYK